MRTAVIGLLLLMVGTACDRRVMVQHSSSMEPTLRHGDHVMVDGSAYWLLAPSRWDLVVFRPPRGASSPVVKDPGIWLFRIVGLPGDEIDWVDGKLQINGKEQNSPPGKSFHYEAASPTYGMEARISYPYRVPENMYFVLGDNTSSARDSRYWGGLPRTNMVGKVVDPR